MSGRKSTDEKPPKPLTLKQVEAAALVASGESYAAILVKVGIGNDTLARWKSLPFFQQRVQEIRDKVAERVQDIAAMQADTRLREQADRWSAMCKTRQKRKELAHATGDAETIPGADSGMYNPTYHYRNGEETHRTWHYDRFFVEGMLRHESALDEGLGQKVPAKLEHSGPNGGPIEVYATLAAKAKCCSSTLFDASLEIFHAADAIKAAGRLPMTPEESVIQFDEATARVWAKSLGLDVPPWDVPYDFDQAVAAANEMARSEGEGQ